MTDIAGRGFVTAGAAVVLALAVSLGVSRCQVRQLQAKHAQAALRADSTAAANDSTREVGAKAQRVLGDSLAGVERRAVQVKQERDALDRALGRERISRTVAQATVDSLLRTRVQSTGVVTGTRSAEDTVGVRRATFDVREVPYTVHAVVSLPPPRTVPATLDTLTVTLDPATLDIRNGCGDAVDGIRPATTSITGPRWLTIALGRVEQDPSLCRSPALQPRGVSRVKWFVIGAGTVVLAGGAMAVAGGR